MLINNGPKINNVEIMLNKYFFDGKPIPEDELFKWVEESAILTAIKDGFIRSISGKFYITSLGKQHINIR